MKSIAILACIFLGCASNKGQTDQFQVKDIPPLELDYGKQFDLPSDQFLKSEDVFEGDKPASKEELFIEQSEPEHKIEVLDEEEEESIKETESEDILEEEVEKEFCGDGGCSIDENCITCPEDCGECVEPCGDGVCDIGGGETCATCPKDCGKCKICGDDDCDPTEDCETCPIDCGICPPKCGDKKCENLENCNVCPEDCGPCAPVCGDGTCGSAENCKSCPSDCGICPPECGDNECNGKETCMDCPIDCGECPSSCGNQSCEEPEDCKSCPTDCGKCPAEIHFNSNWSETLTEPIVAGRPLKIFYDPDRLPDCRGWHNGKPGWTIILYYTFDLSKEATQLQVVQYVDNQVLPFPVEIDIPVDAKNIWFWAKNTDVNGCVAWDSDYGKNYMFPIFTEIEISQPIGWAGAFNFVVLTEAGPNLKGDVDPAYFFEQLLGSEIATYVQAQVYVPGITDRIYQNDEVTKQVAQTAISAMLNTDAYPNGGPGKEFKAFPLEYIGKAGIDNHDFVYRWYPAYFAWFPLPDGAYTYWFTFKTFEGKQVVVMGHPTDPQKMRTMVIAKTIRCDLFPYNPPKEYCE